MTNNFSANLKSFFLLFTILFTITCSLNCYARAFACATQSFDTADFLQAVDDHVLSIRENNIPKAYYKYTDIDFQKTTSLEEFTELVNRHTPLFDNQSIKLSSLQFYEEMGQYTGVITSTSGETLMIEYQLFKSDSGWKILGLKLMNYVCDQKGENPRREKFTVSS